MSEQTQEVTLYKPPKWPHIPLSDCYFLIKYSSNLYLVFPS